MKRWLVAMATFALVAAACTAGGGDDDTFGSTTDAECVARAGHARDVERMDVEG